jgi:putative oxidoreductase
MILASIVDSATISPYCCVVNDPPDLLTLVFISRVISMKIAATVAQYLLGLMFVVFGLNGFLHFIPMPPPETDLAKQYFTVLSQSHYLTPVFVVQLAAGLLFLSNRFIPLALVLIAPVIVNILMFHTLMAPKGIIPGVVASLLWLVIFARYRRAFAGIFRAKPVN